MSAAVRVAIVIAIIAGAASAAAKSTAGRQECSGAERLGLSNLLGTRAVWGWRDSLGHAVQIGEVLALDWQEAGTLRVETERQRLGDNNYTDGTGVERSVCTLKVEALSTVEIVTERMIDGHPHESRPAESVFRLLVSSDADDAIACETRFASVQLYRGEMLDEAHYRVYVGYDDSVIPESRARAIYYESDLKHLRALLARDEALIRPRDERVDIGFFHDPDDACRAKAQLQRLIRTSRRRSREDGGPPRAP